MLSLLETGQALYVLAGICGLGVFARLMTRNLYKRLIKESTNLAAARNRGLKELRQRAENAYHMNQGMRDTASWLEHQLAELHFRGLTLAGWSNLSARLTWLCLLAGGAAAFFSYWYQLDTSYIVMYGGGSVLMAMLMLLLDGNAYLSRREHLLAALQDHLENSMFPRMERLAERNSGVTARNAVVQAAGGKTTEREPGLRAGIAQTPDGREDMTPEQPERGSAAEAGRLQEKSRLSGRPIFADRPGRSKRRERAPEQEPLPQEQTAAAVMPQPERAGTEPPAGPAASKADERNWLKDLGPDEARVIGDILKQYLT